MPRMQDPFEGLPLELLPYLSTVAPNDPMEIAKGPFTLWAAEANVATVQGTVSFRWLPSRSIELEGTCVPSVRSSPDASYVLRSDDPPFAVPVLITASTLGPAQSSIRAVVHGGIEYGAERFESLRFYLANFSDYFGDLVRLRSGEVRRSRLAFKSNLMEVVADRIHEDPVSKEFGFRFTHVVEVFKPTGFTQASASETLDLLHRFFAFLRGARTGPLFPQGLVDATPVWWEFKTWRIDEPNKVDTWLPERHPVDVNQLFEGFCELSGDPKWRDALTNVVSWHIVANGTRAHETRIVLAQVALELLAWVDIVETRQHHSRSDFKKISAAGRIRTLLRERGIPLDVPKHMKELRSLADGESFDGPGIVTKIRNSLVHPTDDRRQFMSTVDGLQLFLCGQLAIQYVELAILSICGYRGQFSQRGWRGWKGDDEVPVPWSETR